MPGSDAGVPNAPRAAGAARAAVRGVRAAVKPVRRRAAALVHQARLAKQSEELREKLAATRRDNANLRDLRREDRERAAAMVAELERLRGDAKSAWTAAQEVGHLFIVTYGRSGSTLLQGVLCSQPGFLIRGENGGVVEQLFRFHTRAMRERDLHLGPVPTSPRSPWHGIDGYPPDLALANMRTLVTETLLRPLPDTRVVGFKEIRWPAKDLPEFLNFVLALFPDARFVVNTRDLDAVVRSGWWATKPNARATVEAAETRMLAAAEALGQRAYHVHYDDYVADPQNLAGLFAWLGEEFDVERVRRVLSRPHSYDRARTAAPA